MNVYIGFCTTATSYTELQKRSKFTIVNSEGLNAVKATSSAFNNKTAISRVYNSFINTYKDEDCILVLTHDDVLITDKEWVNKLHQALDRYDVIGLAGGVNPKIQAPALWHLMCAKEDLKGDVSHVDFSNNSTFTTHFGKNGRVALLDGLFLAFNPKKLFQAGVSFDETCPSKFHFYDLDFSLQCNKAKLKLSTTNIRVTHASPGLKNYTDEFMLGQDWFINKARAGKY
jgi:hypothetical protein